ncbi:MAG: glycosyltransferase family 2 protein [Actinomycetota bacterium]|nr:glycosyltransferase family 2 protein [Actinomycetota bacterium]
MRTGTRTSADPRVSVVVPNWNGLRFLPSCLESVLSQQRVEVELLVIDNGSRDGSRDFLETKGIEHIALDRNLGFARAVNLGIEGTRAPFVLVLNVDTIVAADCLRRLAAELGTDETVGGVQPRILQAGDQVPLNGGAPEDLGRLGAGEPARIYSAGQILLGDGRAFERGTGEIDGPRYRAAGEVFGVSGAACLLRRELLASLDGYDERYFSFYEDVDLNARARLHGWGFRYVPDAVVLHAGNALWKEGAERPSAFNARLVARNRPATALKTLPPRSLPRVLAAELGSLVRSAGRGTFRATLSGKLAVIPWLPDLLAERRGLRREGRPEALERWLDRQP